MAGGIVAAAHDLQEVASLSKNYYELQPAVAEMQASVV